MPEESYIETYPVLGTFNGKLIGFTNPAQARAHALRPNEQLIVGVEGLKKSITAVTRVLGYGYAQLPNPVDKSILDLYERAKGGLNPNLIWMFGQKAAIPSVYDAPELYKRKPSAPDRPPKPRKVKGKDGVTRPFGFRSPKLAVQTRVYTLTNLGMTPDKWPRLPPQARTVLHALIENQDMQPWSELDITQLMAHIVEEGILVTRQDPMRIFLYYKPQLINLGLLKVR